MRIAAQLFTIRDYTRTRHDFVESLRRLKAMGYDEVQLSAVECMNGEVSVTECRAILDDLEIKAPLTHRPWDEIRNRTEECIAFHQMIGAELVAVGSIPGDYARDGLDGYRRFADEAEPAIQKLKAANLLFAYHNHAFEFQRMGEERQRPFDVLMERGSNDFLFEIDTYWVVHAGMDLRSLIGRLSGRIPMVHLKDKAVAGNDPQMAPVGAGNIDWPQILPALQSAGTVLGAVEQDDCYGRDPFDCLAESRQYLHAQA